MSEDLVPKMGKTDLIIGNLFLPFFGTKYTLTSAIIHQFKASFTQLHAYFELVLHLSKTCLNPGFKWCHPGLSVYLVPKKGLPGFQMLRPVLPVFGTRR